MTWYSLGIDIKLLSKRVKWIIDFPQNGLYFFKTDCFWRKHEVFKRIKSALSNNFIINDLALALILSRKPKSNINSFEIVVHPPRRKVTRLFCFYHSRECILLTNRSEMSKFLLEVSFENSFFQKHVNQDGKNPYCYYFKRYIRLSFFEKTYYRRETINQIVVFCHNRPVFPCAYLVFEQECHTNIIMLFPLND